MSTHRTRTFRHQMQYEQKKIFINMMQPHVQNCNKTQVVQTVSELVAALIAVCTDSAQNAHVIQELCTNPKKGILPLMLAAEELHPGFFDMISTEMEVHPQGINLTTLRSILLSIATRINNRTFTKLLYAIVDQIKKMHRALIECETSSFVKRLDAAIVGVVGIAACGAIAMSVAYLTSPAVAAVMHETAATSAAAAVSSAAAATSAVPKHAQALYGGMMHAIGKKQNEILTQIFNDDFSHPIVRLANSVKIQPGTIGEWARPIASADLGIRAIPSAAAGGGATAAAAYIAKAAKDQVKGTLKRRWAGESEAGNEVRVLPKRKREEDEETGLAKRMRLDNDLMWV